MSSLSLKPLGAGDLIDRAVRFYRNNFWTFIFIAAPPALIGTIISIGWTILGRTVFGITGGTAEDRIFSFFYSYLGSIVIWLFQMTAMLAVMGGASRNFVRHILFGEKITFRATYSNVGARLGGLIGGSILIIILTSFLAGAVLNFGISFVMIIAMLVGAAVASISNILAIILTAVIIIAGVFGAGWVFFLAVSRFAYVPQVMTVEGLGISGAIGRSMNLAGKNVGRFAALFIFTTVATYSALALLFIPLGWYAYLNGVDFRNFFADTLPAWYVIGNQVISQISLILLMPVWMAGLCLLYVDERVRREGYDIELMAARHLGEIPAVPQNYTNPLQPALSTQYTAGAAVVNPQTKSSHSVLNLN